jgi:hypothetical protein
MLLASALFAQNPIPNGAILPATLNSALHSRKSKPGQRITATIAQDVPLPSRSKIHAGSKLIGHVLAVSPSTATVPATLSLKFDTIRISGRSVPITTDLRALANMMDVLDAETPMTGPDRGTPSTAWVTNQIGGETNYHSGPIVRGSEIVGESVLGGGAVITVAAKPGSKCRGEFVGNHQPQALWIFASDACGTYGFVDLAIAHAGRTTPVGEIVLTTGKKDVNVPAGSGLLLRVITTSR